MRKRGEEEVEGREISLFHLVDKASLLDLICQLFY
jgi:hypothetical protein